MHKCGLVCKLELTVETEVLQGETPPGWVERGGINDAQRARYEEGGATAVGDIPQIIIPCQML